MKLLLEDVCKNFGDKKVLKGATISFEQGKIIGLLGRNGAGKTTLFNCINADLPLDGGKISIENDDSTVREITQEDIGYVLSTPVVPDFLTGREFLKFFIEINPDKIEEYLTVDDYFEMMHIEKDDRDKLMKDYSHGMKNKMQMLVNIMANSPILLLDEPLTSFDVVVADEMKNLLRNIKSSHIIIFSTHIMELALGLCDEIVILKNGTISEIERGNESEQEYKDKIIAELKSEDFDADESVGE